MGRYTPVPPPSGKRGTLNPVYKLCIPMTHIIVDRLIHIHVHVYGRLIDMRHQELIDSKKKRACNLVPIKIQTTAQVKINSTVLLWLEFCYLPYSGNLSREKTFTNWWENGIFKRQLSWIARSYHLLSTKPSTIVEKTSLIGTKQRNLYIFSIKSLPLYCIWGDIGVTCPLLLWSLQALHDDTHLY